MYLFVMFIVIGLFIKSSNTEISCDFNTGSLCQGWVVEQTSKKYAANWKVWSGHTPTTGSGPKGDRRGKGYSYIYMESTNQKHRDIALLLTPSLEAQNSVVNVTFWYCLHGIFIQSLKLYLIPIKNNHLGIDFEDSELLATIKGEHGSEWKQTSIFLQHWGPFKIGFQAMVGSLASDIAIDDVVISGADEIKDSRTENSSEEMLTSTAKTHRNLYIRDQSVSNAYITICSVGGVLWIIVLLILCYCIYRASQINLEKRSVECNTSYSLGDFTDGKENLMYTPDIVNGDINKIELILDVQYLDDAHINECDTKL